MSLNVPEHERRPMRSISRGSGSEREDSDQPSLGGELMLEKKIGEPCPTCSTPLMRRKSSFRTILGDVAYCARCCSSFEIEREEARERVLAAWLA